MYNLFCLAVQVKHVLQIVSERDYFLPSQRKTSNKSLPHTPSPRIRRFYWSLFVIGGRQGGVQTPNKPCYYMATPVLSTLLNSI